MKIVNLIEIATQKALIDLYDFTIDLNQIQVQNTRKDQEGDITLVVFPLLRFSKKTLEETGKEIGDYIVNKVAEVESFNIIKGFLNLTITNDYWLKNLITSCTVKSGFGSGRN